MNLFTQPSGRRLLSSLFAVALIGCAAPLLADTPHATCSPQGVQQQSDWILVDKSSSNYVCVELTIDWNKYQTYQIEPSSYVPASSQGVLKPKDAEKLTAYFDSKIQASYKNVASGAGETLKIKPVIVGVKRSIPVLNLVGFLLVPFPISYGGAAVHYDLIDGDSGDVIGVVNGVRGGRPWNGLQSLSALGHGRVVLNGDAKRLKRDTDNLAKISTMAQGPTTLPSTRYGR